VTFQVHFVSHAARKRANNGTIYHQGAQSWDGAAHSDHWNPLLGLRIAKRSDGEKSH
jgi:hypothetical protein